MEAKNFGRFVIRIRHNMRQLLKGVIDYRENMDELKEMIGEAFAECTNQFEEDTLKENLQDEFGIWLDKQRARA